MARGWCCALEHGHADPGDQAAGRGPAGGQEAKQQKKLFVSLMASAEPSWGGKGERAPVCREGDGRDKTWDEPGPEWALSLPASISFSISQALFQVSKGSLAN